MENMSMDRLRSFGPLTIGVGTGTIRVGDRFGLLKAIAFQGKTDRNRYVWLWQCDCGNTHYSDARAVKTGDTISCGCFNRQRASDTHSTHKQSETPEYRIWAYMKYRCLNKGHADYHRYGGRGITIDPDWKDSFENFIRDMGPRPSIEHSIERRDTNGNYCKANCHWATRHEQTRNRTSNLYLDYKGEIMTVMDFVRKIGSDYSRTMHLLKTGRTPEEVVSIVNSGIQAPRLKGLKRDTSLLTYTEMSRRKTLAGSSILDVYKDEHLLNGRCSS